MDEHLKICRLCLKTIEKDATYFPLTNNTAVLQNLNLISFATIKNLPLTEHPVICDLCDNKLIELANFKENITSNEYQIQCTQQHNVNLFLEDISKDFQKICRLCLKTSEETADLQKNWEDSKEIFVKCNIHLNLNILQPSKVCNLCDTTLQNLWSFVSSCAENEQLIANEAIKNKNLSLEDIIKVEPIEGEILNNDKSGEDNNNFSQQQKSLTGECSSKNTENTEAITVKENSNERNYTTSAKEISPGKNVSESNNLRENKSDHNEISDEIKNIVNVESSDLEDLTFTRTPNTYTRSKSKISQNKLLKASTSKLKIVSDICFRKQEEPSTSKLLGSEISIDQIQDEYEGDTCIDVSLVTNVADITLDMSLGRVLELDSTEEEKDNVTKDLIDLLEGTEEHAMTNGVGNDYVTNNVEYRHTEELLRVLEDDSDVIVFGIDGQLNNPVRTYRGECEQAESPKAKTGHAKTVLETIQVIQETEESSGQSNNKVQQSPVIKKNQNLKSSKGKRTSTSVIKKSGPIKEKCTPKGKNKIFFLKTNTISINSKTQIGAKGHNLRQKTIVTSFREMLNMKPVKNKLSGSTENIEEVQIQESRLDNEKTEEKQKSLLKKEPVQRTRKHMIEHKEKEFSHDQAGPSNSQKGKTSKELQTVSEIQDVSFEKIEIQEISLVDDENAVEDSQKSEKTSIKKGPIKAARGNRIKGQRKDLNNDLPDVERAVQTRTSEINPEVQEVNGVVVKKRGKRKVVLETQKEEVPKKRVRKLIQNNSEKSSTNNEEGKEKSPPIKKKQVKGSKKTLESKKAKTAEQTEANGHVISQDNKESDPDTNDGDESDVESQTSDNKPVVVTIIRRNKTKNRAQRDKTWQELTGKAVGTAVQVDDGLPRRRGRPPLPESKKKKQNKVKPPYFTCKFCPFKTISKNIVIQHQFIHNVVDDFSQYKCGQCGLRAANEETLEQHKLSHLMLEIIYKCMFCEYSNKKKNSTMYHTLRHVDRDISNMFYCLAINQISEEEQYECFQCEYQNTEEAVMPDHVIDHQVEKIKNPIMTKFSCKQCLYKSKFENLFKRHLEMHEEQKKKQKTGRKEVKKEIKTEPQEVPPQDDQEEVVTVYSCDKCHYLTYNKRSLTNHKGLKHTRHAPPNADLEARRKKRKVPQPDEIYQCNECDYATQKKPHLTRHMIIHRSKENMEFFECTHCIFETKHRRSYKRHMEIKHKVIV